MTYFDNLGFRDNWFNSDYEDDYEGYPAPPPRTITVDMIRDLIDVLVGTEDSLDIGISQIGIDPYSLSGDEKREIRSQLARYGIRRREGVWCR